MGKCCLSLHIYAEILGVEIWANDTVIAMLSKFVDPQIYI